MRITAGDVASCAGGTLVGPDLRAEGVWFDTRSITAGQAFVALVTGNDGHDFVADAFAKGAPFAIVGRGRSVAGGTCVEVDDTAEALTQLGRNCAARLRPTAAGRVVAVTGSAGKTSTKDMIHAVLRAAWPSAHKAPGSFNNDFGVPVTLACAPDGCEAIVLEYGMRWEGEIARLCGVARPDIAVVTIVGDAHSERVGGIEAVARIKSEIVSSLSADGTAVLNADDHRVAAMAGLTAARKITYGTSADADVQCVVAGTDDLGRATARFTWGDHYVTDDMELPGEHMVMNAAAAVAVGVAAGVPFGDAVNAACRSGTAPMRMEWLTAADGTRVLDDSYNANSSSMAAALRTLASTAATYRYAVLGAMAEVADADSAHGAVARLADSLGITVIALETDAYGTPARGVDDAVAAVVERGRDTVVLVKGSRSSRAERVIEGLLRG
ncbi:MAG: UDP-N-acetylmuramoyl-tripeptide--D-alanyl-D-alanine ligase [Acidimicrobiales bacterium]